MSVINYKKAQARVDECAGLLGKTPPNSLHGKDGAPSNELLAFCHESGMPLDWAFLGGERLGRLLVSTHFLHPQLILALVLNIYVEHSPKFRAQRSRNNETSKLLVLI